MAGVTPTWSTALKCYNLNVKEIDTCALKVLAVIYIVLNDVSFIILELHTIVFDHIHSLLPLFTGPPKSSNCIILSSLSLSFYLYENKQQQQKPMELVVMGAAYWFRAAQQV